MNSARLNQFTWNKKDRTLTAEASDLGVLTQFGMPTKFTVMSTTNVEFTISRTILDEENDVVYWSYMSKDLPRPVELLIFND